MYNDIYLLLSGDASIVIKGNEYTTRKAGRHVGFVRPPKKKRRYPRMLLRMIPSCALKLTNAQFMSLGRSFPQIWLPIARESMADSNDKRNKIMH